MLANGPPPNSARLAQAGRQGAVGSQQGQQPEVFGSQQEAGLQQQEVFQMNGPNHSAVGTTFEVPHLFTGNCLSSGGKPL